MVIRAPVEPVMLTWARERAGMHEATLALRFPRLREWEQGRVAPTLKQLEAFAAATFVPTGVLFLKSPPEERLPIPDFRTMGGGDVERPSPHLLETIYDCADRQAWYRSHARQNSEPALAFVGSASLGTPVSDAAESMAQVLRFGGVRACVHIDVGGRLAAVHHPR